MAQDQDMNITVIGGSRGTGALVVQHAVAAGHTVRSVSRSGGAAPGAEHLALDATDANALRSAVHGADAVIVTVGGTGRQAPRAGVTQAVIEAMRAEGVRRLLVQSSYGVGDSFDGMPFVVKRIVVPLLLKHALADHAVQEQLVADSGLDWTVLRPGGLTNEPATGRVKLGPSAGGPGILGRVSREAVAALLLSSIDDPATYGHAFTIAS